MIDRQWKQLGILCYATLFSVVMLGYMMFSHLDSDLSRTAALSHRILNVSYAPSSSIQWSGIEGRQSISSRQPVDLTPREWIEGQFAILKEAQRLNPPQSKEVDDAE